MKKNTVLLDLFTYDELIEKSNIYNIMFCKPDKSILISSNFEKVQTYKSLNFIYETEKDITNNVYYYIETDMINVLKDKINKLTEERNKAIDDIYIKEQKKIWFKKMIQKFFM